MRRHRRRFDRFARATCAALPIRGVCAVAGASSSFILQAKDQFKNLSIRGGDRVKVQAAGALSAEIKDLQNTTRLSRPPGDTRFELYPATHRLDALGARLPRKLFGEVRQLQQHWVTIPHTLHGHLAELHGSEGWREPA